MKILTPVLVLGAAALTATPVLAQWSVDVLSQDRRELAATSVGTKALFAGGLTTLSTFSDVVDIYDNATNTWTSATLSQPRRALAATTVGTKAIFAGGTDGSDSDVVDIYDDATGMWTTAVLAAPRSGLAATSVGTKAFFGGGYWTDFVDIYDDATGMWTTAVLSVVRGDLTAASVGTKAMFAGGWSGVPSDTVDIYDDATGMWTTHVLSQARNRLTAATVGDKIVFSGGGTAIQGNSDVVDIYDDSTGMWSVATLSEPREYLTSTSVGNEVLVGGGYNGVSFTTVATVDIYDAGTNTWTTSALSAPRWGLAATTVGNKAMFAGGSASGNVVDIYTGTGAMGQNYCGPAVANSTGQGAVMGATGSVIAADDDVELSSTQMPNNQFGYFLNSQTQAFTFPVPSSQGALCLGGAIGRYNASIQNTGNAGTISLVLSLPNTPTPSGTTAIVAGETWNFTCWYRDTNPGSTSNFSDGLSIQFQ